MPFLFKIYKLYKLVNYISNMEEQRGPQIQNILSNSSGITVNFYNKNKKYLNHYPIHPEPQINLIYVAKKYSLSIDMIEMSFYFEDIHKARSQSPTSNELDYAEVKLRNKISEELFDLMIRALFGETLYLDDSQITEFFILYEELGMLIIIIIIKKVFDR